ncbi:MAG: SirB1 family protein [Dehalococcoidia bacterium]
MDPALIRQFQAAIAGKERDVDLFGAVMLIARLGDPKADPHAVARELDLIAESVAESITPGARPDEVAHAIDHELFVVAGFAGNSNRYAEPENSYLDQVIARRTGIPIALSLVYMEVAERVGLQCDGIGYPGHFIVRCGDPEDPIYVDPFHQGVRIDREELLARLRGQNLGGATPESFLSAVTRRQILQRVLRNLHLIFRERRDLERWLSVVEMALCIEPWNAALVGERGMLHYRAGRHELALTDLQRYVEASSPEALTPGTRRLIDELRLQLGRGRVE